MTAMNEDPGLGGGRPDDELPAQLRRRLHDAVADISPAPDALDRLRDAVPARRRRRRAVMMTTAATVVVLAVATPMVRTMVITDQNTQNSGNGTETLPNTAPGADTGDAGEETDDDGGGTLGIGSVGGIAGSGGARPSPSQQPAASPSATPSSVLPSFAPSYLPGLPLPTDGVTAASASAAPSASTPPPVPACTVDDLEQGTGTHLGQAGSDGIAYGVVEIRNISKRDCSVTGQVNVMVASPPGNPPIQVSVKVHQQGDPAVRLPEVSATTGPLTVRQGATYEFQF
ncbi:MAG: hypothetical protein HOV68_25160, partial [Streptomycetaceae bacterium]|nr:hypothetical protein [Streptomycetaceae bacterium]